MTTAYIGIGSNIDPEKHIPMALERLQQQLTVVGISSFYKLPAMGTAEGQSDFINGMIVVETSLTAKQLKYSVLREIEYELGRNKEQPKYSAREMDLDLILFGDEVIPELNVPEPEIKTRPYVFLPLLELNKFIKIPGENIFLADLMSNQKIEAETFKLG